MNYQRIEYLNQEQANQVLEQYTHEHSIDIERLPTESIQRFVDAIRYAPTNITTESIAQATGITRANQRPRTNYTLGSNSLLRVPHVSIETPQRPRINHAEIARQLVSEEVLADIPYVTSSVGIGHSMIAGTRGETKHKPRRSEADMMAEIVRGENFPKPNFKDWSSDRELGGVVDDWYRNVEYREQWIFSRREREGFNRRNVGFFSLDDVMSRMTKRKKGHELDTETSKFYDWKLGGTDWVLRLELYQHEQYYFLITRHIHKPTNIEIKYDVRYWSQNKFKVASTMWTEAKNRPDSFERVFGSTDENSDYYIAPCVHDEEECDNDYYDAFDEMHWEGGEGDDD